MGWMRRRRGRGLPNFSPPRVHPMRQEWRNMSKAVRYYSTISVTAGFALIYIGALLDQKGAWRDLPFLTNMYSALASAAFGVPIALVVITRISSHQEKQAARLQARRALDQAVRDLAQAVDSIFRPHLHYAAASTIRSSVQSALEAERQITERNAKSRDDVRRYLHLRAQLAIDLEWGIGDLEPEALRAWWSAVQDRWKYINDALRHQFYQLHIAWPISPDLTVQLSDLFSAQPEFSALARVRDEASSAPEERQLDMSGRPLLTDSEVRPGLYAVRSALAEVRTRQPVAEAAGQFAPLDAIYENLNNIQMLLNNAARYW